MPTKSRATRTSASVLAALGRIGSFSCDGILIISSIVGANGGAADRPTQECEKFAWMRRGCRNVWVASECLARVPFNPRQG
jgi:hypothetical protein